MLVFHWRGMTDGNCPLNRKILTSSVVEHLEDGYPPH